MAFYNLRQSRVSWSRLFRQVGLPTIATLVIVAACASSVPAQQAASATLSGSVKDPNGAVVSGARVSVTQQGTGGKRETTTSDQGLFVLTNLPADDYEVRIESKGFTV